MADRVERLRELQLRYMRLIRNRDECAQCTADPDYPGNRAGAWQGLVDNEVDALAIAAEIAELQNSCKT